MREIKGKARILTRHKSRICCGSKMPETSMKTGFVAVWRMKMKRSRLLPGMRVAGARRSAALSGPANCERRRHGHKARRTAWRPRPPQRNRRRPFWRRTPRRHPIWSRFSGRQRSKLSSRFGAKPSCNGSTTGSFRLRRRSAPPGATGRVCRSRPSSRFSSEKIRLGSMSGVTCNGLKGDARRPRGRSRNAGREPGLGRQTRVGDDLLRRAAPTSSAAS